MSTKATPERHLPLRPKPRGIDLVVTNCPKPNAVFSCSPGAGLSNAPAWLARFRRLGRDYERLAPTFTGFHWLAFLSLMLNSLFR